LNFNPRTIVLTDKMSNREFSGREFQELSSPGRELFRAIEQFTVVDVHEHIPPEPVRLQQDVGILTLFQPPIGRSA